MYKKSMIIVVVLFSFISVNANAGLIVGALKLFINSIDNVLTKSSKKADDLYDSFPKQAVNNQESITKYQDDDNSLSLFDFSVMRRVIENNDDCNEIGNNNKC